MKSLKPKAKKSASKSALTKRQKQTAISRAGVALHNGMFGLHRAGFALIDILVYASKGGEVEYPEQVPTDSQLYHLRREAREALRHIDSAIDALRPYARPHLGDPVAAFAALDKKPS